LDAPPIISLTLAKRGEKMGKKFLEFAIWLEESRQQRAKEKRKKY